MAETAESLVIAVELAMEAANREWEAFKKKVETPLRVTFADGSTAASGTATGQARTFTGQPMVSGPLNAAQTVNTPNPVTRGPGLQDMAQGAFVSRSMGMGGTGFGPAAGPLPTAHVNSVFGGISPGVSMREVTSARLGRLPTIALDMSSGWNSGGAPYNGPAVQPSIGPGAPPFAVPAGWSSGMQLPGTTAAAHPGSPYLGPGGAPGQQTGVPLAQAAFNRATGRTVYPGTLTALNPAAASMGGRGGSSTTGAFGGIGVENFTRFAGGAAVLAHVADRYATDSIQARETLRYESTADAASDAYQAARSATGGQRLGGRIGNALFGAGTFNDGTNTDAARDAAAQARAQTQLTVGLRQNRAIARDNAAIGLSGINATMAGINNAATGEIAEIDAQIRERGNADAGDLYGRRALVGQRRDRQVQAAAYDSRTGILRTMGTARSSAFAANLSSTGDSFQGELAAINAQFDPAINEQVRNLDKGGKIDPQVAANIAALRLGRGAARQTAMRGRRDELSELKGGALEAAGQLNFDPFGGALRGIAARYAGQLEGRSGPDADLLRGQKALEEAGVRQQQALRTLDVGFSLSSESRSLGARGMGDDFTAGIIDIGSSGIQRARDIFRGDRENPQLAESARNNTIAAINVERRNFARSFRAESYDARFSTDRNSRDAQDPSEVFAKTAAERANVATADITTGAVDEKIAKPIVDKLDQLITEIKGLGTD